MRRTKIALATVLALTLMSACGGDDDAGGTDTTDAPDAPDETTEQTDAPEVDTTAATGDDAAEQAAAMAALEQFFTLYSQQDFDGAAALLENGETFRESFQTLYDSFNVGANALGAAATEATLLPDAEAEVIYDLSFGGTVVLTAASGLMVKEDGQWKLAESSWNALVKLSTTAATTVP
ncbi:MAG: hypothetical protein ACT4OX_04265 [Actinomycetota bacterium]